MSSLRIWCLFELKKWLFRLIDHTKEIIVPFLLWCKSFTKWNIHLSNYYLLSALMILLLVSKQQNEYEKLLCLRNYACLYSDLQNNKLWDINLSCNMTRVALYMSFQVFFFFLLGWYFTNALPHLLLEDYNFLTFHFNKKKRSNDLLLMPNL